VAISHKRDADARRTFRMPKAPYLAGGLAVAATLSTVGLGLVAANPETRDLVVASSTSNVSSAADDATSEADTVERPQVVSRSQARIVPEEPWEDMLEKQAVAKAVRAADDKLWTTAALNLWATPGEDAGKTGLLEESKKVLVTGREAAGRVEVVVDGDALWVTSGYLTDENPNAVTATSGGGGSDEEAAPSLGGACTNGTSVEGQPNILAVHEAVCASFPELTSYGTYRSDGEHSQGLAIDIMVSGARGWEVAEFVRANYAELGVNYIMYSQKIWSVDRSSEGWRYVEDRGSVTANHYDHVHVTTY
jgi:hypothetical protein